MGRITHEPADVAEPLSKGVGSGVAPDAGTGVLSESPSTSATAAMTTARRNERCVRLPGAQSAVTLMNRGLG